MMVYNLDMKTETLYRLPEAARILRVHPRTLKRWHAQGKVKLVELPNGQFRISEIELSRLIDNHRMSNN